MVVVHNRYRFRGGEERAVELQIRALARSGIRHRLVERRSDESSRIASGLALLAGGAAPDDVARAVREADAAVVHAHNIHPLFGPKSLASARAHGARVVLQLHNVRLFCAIAVAARDGKPCFRCRGRFTLPGLVLNCRGSVPEAVAYAAGLALHQPKIWQSVDAFIAPSRHAAEQLALLGVPRERLNVVPHYLPEEAFVSESRADMGRFALAIARLSTEKGLDTAVRAAVAARIPLRVAGEGPCAEELAALARRFDGDVTFLGQLTRVEVDRELTQAAMLLLPSRYDEFAPYAVLEAMAAGVPVVGTNLGSVPELVGNELCVAANDVDALATAARSLWDDPPSRRHHGERLLSGARARFSEHRYLEDLRRLYALPATRDDSHDHARRSRQT